MAAGGSTSGESELGETQIPGEPIKAQSLQIESIGALTFRWSMIPRIKPEGLLFGKPVSTFPDHALKARRLVPPLTFEQAAVLDCGELTRRPRALIPGTRA